MPVPVLIDSTDRLHLEVDKNMKVQTAVVEAFQDIPDFFLRDLQDQRTAQDAKFAPDDVKIASLPGALVDHWYRQGFNIWDRNITPQDIIDRLIREDLTAFLTTSKTFA
jgi:hypothetical protein